MQHRKITYSRDSDRRASVYLYEVGETNHNQRLLMMTLLRQAVMKELTEKQRFCVVEYYINNRHMNDIASELGLNPSTVSRHIQRAVKRLKRVSDYYDWTIN